MYGIFVEVGVPESGRLTARVERALTQLGAEAFGGQLALTRCLSAELDEGGVVWAPQAPAPGARAISHCETRDTKVAVVFGEVYGAESAATAILDRWSAGGIDAARRMDGRFGAVLIERSDRSVFVICDLIGLRSLRVVELGPGLIVSNSDLALAATGAFDLEPDPAGLHELASFDWPLGQRTSLRRVRAFDATTYLHYRDGQLQSVRAPLVDLGRTAALPRAAKAERAAAVDRAAERIEASAASEPVAELCAVELTAGFDSRASLAAVWSSPHRPVIQARTGGPPEARDVRVAARLAGLLGCPHVISPVQPPDPEGFVTKARWIAAYGNGEANVRRAVVTSRLLVEVETPVFTGNAGGIYRTHFHDPVRAALGFETVDLPAVAERLEGRLLGGRRLPPSPFSRERRGRLRSRLEDLGGLDPAESRLMSAFLLYERHGRWGSRVARFTRQTRRRSVFETPTALESAFSLPYDDFAAAAIHRRLVERHVPELLKISVNGGGSLRGPRSRWASLTRTGRVELAKVQGDAEQLLFRKRRQATAVRLDLLATELLPVLRESILGPDSPWESVFDRDALRSMLTPSGMRARHAAHVAGFMMSASLHRELCRRFREAGTSG